MEKLLNQLKRFKQRFAPMSPPEPLMYRVYLFEELLALSKENFFEGKRVLEIGPKDGLDTKRLATLQPKEVVTIDLPEKQVANQEWMGAIACPHRHIEANLMYMSQQEYSDLGLFDLIWCTGVLYHNAEQLRFLRRLFQLMNPNGYLVLESATARNLSKKLREGCYVEIYYPQTYRDTGTVTHLPTANAIKAWLKMVGFEDVYDSDCHARQDKRLVAYRMACISQKCGEQSADIYYGKSGLNPAYRFGDST